MPNYRLYFFRSETGHIREVREFEAQHDFAAIYQAAAWRSNESMELWSGSRKITRWIPHDVAKKRTVIVQDRDEIATARDKLSL